MLTKSKLLLQVCEDTSLCMAAHQTQAALPSGGIAMAAITPFAGLFKWCILAPLTTPAAEYAQVEHLYSKLYLGLLKNLLEVINLIIIMCKIYITKMFEIIWKLVVKLSYY